jgi:redox-regulated HSP33 family molecular chaperone
MAVGALNAGRPQSEQLDEAVLKVVVDALEAERKYANAIAILQRLPARINHAGYAGSVAELAAGAQSAWQQAEKAMPGLEPLPVAGGAKGELTPRASSSAAP